ncbi:MAG: ApbE family lipoprotein [Thermotoga sp. 50_1627]|uniref:UPF0280 family protein n=1 Tax=Pseudothermotoga sp. TaxID=2033661 RepID=UPI00076DD6F3|nr:MAG: ApbE family lipoprotein [Thermotoga sp. 50_64]KUK25240.1 MAG: ApbE family lipoprotein [Thermotoga sp. 50_1627]MBC7116272.1 UPF0280 family protein [Pseudothermotoga sp.]MDK2923290.1 uncharacterized protein [Pseudothermotoga sp.]HBT38704.1 UPF0280 family protein [Pseudothermotoga sp.]
MKKFYRECSEGRFQSFTVQYRETDLWIGVDRFDSAMPEMVLELVQKLYCELYELAKVAPQFFSSLEPVQLFEGPKIALKMAQAAERANVGPTAAVAGAIADEAGELLLKEFECNEVLVENGGDIFIRCERPINSLIYAGESPLSNRIALKLPKGTWGVCTSSGRFGHSLSFGTADAITVICRNATIADAFATAYCNMVKNKNDVENLLSYAINEDVLGVVVIYEDMLGVRGQFEIVLLDGDEDETHR